MDTSRKLSASLVIGAPAEDIFTVLADPNRHTAIDGNDMVQGPDGDPAAPLGGIGQVFVMRMHRPDLGDYRMINSVTAFVPGARIGWAPTLDPGCELASRLGDMEATGHTYTFDLREVEGGTEVTETYDWTGVKDERFAAMLPLVSEQQLEDGLHKLAAAVG